MCSMNSLTNSKLEHGCCGSRPMWGCHLVSTMKGVCWVNECTWLLVFPDLSKVQTSSTFGIDSTISGMYSDKVCVLGYTVDDIHNCIIAMVFRQLNYEVNTDYVPNLLENIALITLKSCACKCMYPKQLQG
jgi:hypothetical protein